MKTKTNYLITLLIFSFASASGPAEGQEFTKMTFTYKMAGNLPVRADVYMKDNNTPKPAILWIHGGALIMGNRRGLARPQLERYLRAGYTVISIDYRLAPQAKLPQIIEDLRDAYFWILTDGPALFSIDPGRIAVVGHSAGGYLALMAGCVLKPSPRALVSFYGYGDIAGDWYSKPDPFYNLRAAVSREEALQSVGNDVISEDLKGNRDRFYLYTRQKGTWPYEVTGHDPAIEPHSFDPYCPLRNITSRYPPTLLLHGDNDTDVPYQQSVMMNEELRKNGVETGLVTLKGLGHGFDRNMEDPQVAAAFGRVLEFLDQKLKP